MTPPLQTVKEFPTYTNPSVLPNSPPIDPDANKQDDKKGPSDVPIVSGKAKEEWNKTYYGHLSLQ
jgi:hypothetical protein